MNSSNPSVAETSVHVSQNCIWFLSVHWNFPPFEKQEVVMFFTLIEVVKKKNLLDSKSLGTAMDFIGYEGRHRL